MTKLYVGPRSFSFQPISMSSFTLFPDSFDNHWTGQASIPTAPTAPFETDDAIKAEEKAIKLVQMLVVGPKWWLESIRRQVVEKFLEENYSRKRNCLTVTKGDASLLRNPDKMLLAWRFGFF